MIERWNKRVIRTQWFSRKVKPAHVGIYELLCPHEGLEIVYAYWNGTYWGIFAHSISVALKFCNTESYHAEIYWRGRVNKSKRKD